MSIQFCRDLVIGK